MGESVKRCSKCGEKKPPTEFSRDRSRVDGRYPRCQDCMRSYYAENRTRIRKQQNEHRRQSTPPPERREVTCLTCGESFEAVGSRERMYCSSRCKSAGWYRSTREVTSEYRPIDQPDDPDLRRCPGCDRVLSLDSFHEAHTRPQGVTVYCKECQSERDTERYWDDPEHHRERRRRYYEENPEKAREAARRWYAEHREEAIASTLRWMDDNPDRWREIKRAAAVRRKARKRDATVVDFTSRQLAERLSVFGYRCWLCGTTAEQVDHVKPISKGGLHILSNLRPVCGPCNMKKGDKWPVPERLVHIGRTGINSAEWKSSGPNR